MDSPADTFSTFFSLSTFLLFFFHSPLTFEKMEKNTAAVSSSFVIPTAPVYAPPSTDLWATLIWRLLFHDRQCYLCLVSEREIKKKLFFMVYARNELYLCPGSLRVPYLYQETEDSEPVEATLCDCPIMHDGSPGVPGRLYRSARSFHDATYYCQECAVHYDYCWICREDLSFSPTRSLRHRPRRARTISNVLTCMFCGRVCQWHYQQLQPRCLAPLFSDDMVKEAMDAFDDKRDRKY